MTDVLIGKVTMAAFKFQVCERGLAPRRGLEALDGRLTRSIGIVGRAAKLALCAGGVTLAVGRAAWGISGVTCVSNDNHVYFILRGNVANEGTQVTSVAMTSGNAAGCSEGPPSDGVLTTLAVGVQGTGAQSALLPNRMRTTIIDGAANSSVSCNDFDPSANGGTGLLTLPSGGTVSVGGGTIPLVDVHTADPAVPAAVDLASETRTVGLDMCSGSTMAFPLPNPQQAGCAGSGTSQVVESDATQGEQPCQTVTFDDHNLSTVGNISGGSMPFTMPPMQTMPDGFLLQGSCSADVDCQVIVFVASGDTAAGFGVAAAGFKITTTGEVFGTDNFSTSDQFNSTPTPTPRSTGTPLSTATATATHTAQCGDGIVTAPETCDPPGSLQPPNNNPCRPDCTFCGDGIVNGLETCDDGNSNNNDKCHNDCTRHLRNDPVWIWFRSPGQVNDRLRVHGSFENDHSIDPTSVVVGVRLSDANGVVYSASVPVGAMSERVTNERTFFRFKDANAKSSPDGGIGAFKVSKDARWYRVNVWAYGDLSAATSEMTMDIFFGHEQYTSSGRWKRTLRGWYLFER